MARVTVEDCVEKLPNRFELVMVAAQRARKIGSGASLTVDRDNDKNAVVSLREIAVESIDIENLKEELIRNHQRIIPNDDEETIDFMDGEQEWGTIASRSLDGDEEDDGEEGMYADENIGDEDEGEPSLQDLAGNPVKE